MDEIKVQVNFTADTIYGSYGDALYFTELEWASTIPTQVEAMKQARIDKWVAYMASVTSPPLPTKEELQKRVAGIEETIAERESRRLELLAQIAGM